MPFGLLAVLACGIVAGFIQQRAGHIAMLWASFVITAIGGIIFANEALGHATLKGFNVIPDGAGYLGALCLAIVVLDLLDLQPNQAATFCVFFVPLLAVDTFTVIGNGGLPGAVILGMWAGIAQRRAAGKYRNTIKWVSAGVALAGGVMIADIGLVSDIVDFLGVWAGLAGSIVVVFAGIDVSDKRPDIGATVCCFLIPALFFPFTDLWGDIIGYALDKIGS